ncbi:DRTGG domain-containing protein [Clostridium hydrogeniformans]|uniref:DRTGG domain-containing protein n=1 Tax=Clostridium hydrogeniformans TaxID=349933 RepID=UPI000488E9A6|nr:DRTGG domain-containing protein [Clostridium hydrogeniformans]
MSKQEDIMLYIKTLEPGHKISVRSIAGDLGVSEGTAYRAIKECEAIGIVTTIPRVGTVRVEKIDKRHMENLTFSKVLSIVNGSVLGGKEGLNKSLNRFTIGAMTVDAFSKYVSPGSLVIVGNREEIQRFALEQDAAVLISGGFGCRGDIKKLADDKKLPIISSNYDTFTIASMINKALSDNKIKNDIILIEEVMMENPACLTTEDTLETWMDLVKKTKHIRYPVVDKDMRVVGIMTAKDLPDDLNTNEPIKKLMIKDPITVTPKTTVSYAAHIMGWEDIELCPVVDGRKLVGVITRKDVIKAFEYMNTHGYDVENLEESILKNFTCANEGSDRVYEGKITPRMLDNVGTASWSALNMLINAVAVDTLKKYNITISVDNISTYFMKPVQVDSNIIIRSRILDLGRSFCKVEAEMFNVKKELVGKSLLSAIIIKE